VAEEEREGETLATPYYTSRFDEHVWGRTLPEKPEGTSQSRPQNNKHNLSLQIATSGTSEENINMEFRDIDVEGMKGARLRFHANRERRKKRSIWFAAPELDGVRNQT
jgi:hypothetical protein